MSDPEIPPNDDLSDQDVDAVWDPSETDEVDEARRDEDVLHSSLQESVRTQILAGAAAAAARDKASANQSAPPPLEGQLSPTLLRVEESRRPPQKDENMGREGPLACATCPNARWFETYVELSCHCTAFHTLTWTTHAPGQIEYCDARELALEALTNRHAST